MDAINSLIPADQLSFLKCQLMSLLFADLYHRHLRPLKQTTTKHVYTFLVSNLLLYLLLGGFRPRILFSIYTPVFLTFLWTTKLKWNPWVLTVGLFGQLAWTHWSKMQERYLNYNLDQSVVLMLMVIKLTSFAFDMADNPVRVGLMEFLGYTFMFPGFVSGPAILFPQYRAFINDHSPQHHHQKRLKQAMKQFAMALLFGLAHVLMGFRFNHNQLLSDWYHQLPLIERLIRLHLTNMSSRFMYYTAWLMAESSLIIMGFEPDSVKIVRPLRIELAYEPRQILLNWNISTDRWLHRYFYSRLYPTLGASWSNVAVKMVSACWHGFYPGYYCMFASFGLVSLASRAIYRKCTLPLWFSAHKATILWVPCWLIVDYLTPPFVLLTWQKSVTFYRQSHWWGHVMCIIILLALQFKTKPKQ